MRVTFSSVVAALAATATLWAQAPANYYATVDSTNAVTLRATLHAVIDDHTDFPYTSGATDTWNVLEAAQEDPTNSNRVVDIYRNDSYPKQGGGNSLYNREHTWPRSYGFPNGNNFGPFTDCHQLFLCNDSYNSSRSNKPYNNCASSHQELVTTVTNGTGGGSGVYPGNSNWSAGSFSNGSWEVWNRRKGDVARAQLYLDVRYEGGSHGGTGNAEPDLVLTDDRGLIASTNTGNNEPIAYHGLLSVLLQWHLDDPPDAEECARNDVVFAFQGNRNPFVDNPQWVNVLFGLSMPGSAEFFGAGCNGGTGATPLIGFTGAPDIGQPVTVNAFLSPASAPAALHLDFVRSSFDLSGLGFVGCNLFVLPTLSLNTVTSVAGFADATIPVPMEPLLVGVHLTGQWLFVDTVDSSLAASGGVDFTIGN